MSDLWDKLAAEFPRSAISWRAQSLTKDGTKAMALAYLDSRDIRRRLNEVVGPANWQNEFRDCGDGKLACRLSVRIDGEWIHKEDGAGATQVEAEKGAFSSALKRAAVAFGIGEYLYDMPTIWVPCESREFNGKHQWQSWKADPWDSVRQPANRRPEPPKPTSEQPKTFAAYVSDIAMAKTSEALKEVFAELWRSDLPSKDKTELKQAYEGKKAELSKTAPSFDNLAPNDVDHLQDALGSGPRTFNDTME